MTPSCARPSRRLEKVYVAGIQSHTLVWAPGTRHSGAPKKGRRDSPRCEVSVKDVALGLRANAWRTIAWYLTKDWAEDKNRRHKVGVPEEIIFRASLMRFPALPRMNEQCARPGAWLCRRPYSGTARRHCR